MYYIFNADNFLRLEISIILQTKFMKLIHKMNKNKTKIKQNTYYF